MMSQSSPPNVVGNGMGQRAGNPVPIMSQIVNHLSSRPTPQGWQKTYRVEHRAHNIHQIVTQLKLVKPDMDGPQALHVAMGFEEREFTLSPDQQTYSMHCRQKMQAITQARQDQANMHRQRQGQNNQFNQVFPGQAQMQPHGMMPNQNQFHQPYGIPQPQQPMQARGIPMQQQLSQQQQQQQLQLQRQLQMQMENPTGLQTNIQNSLASSNAPLQPQQGRPPSNLRPEEQERVTMIAEHMAANLSMADKQNLTKYAQNMPPETRQSVQATGMDPVRWLIRNQALKKYLEGRNNLVAQRGQSGQVPGSGAMPQQRSTSRNAMLPQGRSSVDPSSATGNMDQILGQQQEALRHQEAGQVVVPASGGQRPPSQFQQRNPQQPPNPQYGSNPQTQTPNQFSQQGQSFGNSVQNQARTDQPTPQISMQTPNPNVVHAAGQTPQKGALQGQLGGLSNPIVMRTPQQQHSMPTLNQPMDPSNQSQNNASPQPGQINRKVGPRNDQPTPSTSLRGGVNGQLNQQRPGGPPNMPAQRIPPDVERYLRSLPEEKRKVALLTMQAKRRQVQEQNANNTGDLSHAGQGSRQGQPPGFDPKAQPNQALNAHMPANGMVKGAQQYPPSASQIEASKIQQQRRTEAMRAKFAMNEKQIQEMDNVVYPSSILNDHSLGRMPRNAKTWGDLKAWVSQNTHALPPDSLTKVSELQGRHWHVLQLQLNQLQQENRPNQQMGPVPGAHIFGNQPGMQGPNLGLGSAAGMMGFPEPSAEDIQNVRRKLAPVHSNLTDEQIRSFIISKKYSRPNANGDQAQMIQPGQPGFEQQQQILYAQQRNLLLAQQTRDAQRHGLQNAQSQPANVPQISQMPQQRPSSTAKQEQPPSINQAKRTGTQPNQNGMKRSNNEDVVEISNPNVGQQVSAPTAVMTGSVTSIPGMPNFTPQQYAAMTPAQKAALLAQQQRIQTARTKPPAKGPNAQGTNSGNATNVPVDMARDAVKFRQIMLEAHRDSPLRNYAPMSPMTRGRMMKTIKINDTMLLRLDQFLPAYYRFTRNEALIGELARMRFLLFQQVREDKITPVDNFTMSADELEGVCAHLHSHFQILLTHMNHGPVNRPQQQLPNSGERQNQNANELNKAGPQPQQLNTDNLRQQQEALQKSRAATMKDQHKNRAPPAPTSSHAPFTFGQQSPQDVTQFFQNKNELTQEKLVLPPSKRRKGNSAASPPSAAVKGSKGSPIRKVESPEVARGPAIERMAKCPKPGCKSSGGFATKADIDRHIAEVHEPKEEEITDPLGYALEGFRMALNLDVNGKPRPAEQKSTNETLQAPAMKPALSAQGKTFKQEASTPMSRSHTGTGPSPAASLLRTPQTTANVKTPTSDTKPTSKDVSKSSSTVAKESESTAALSDSWSTSNVSRTWFPEVFQDVASLNTPVSSDFLSDWLEVNPFTPTTPSSPPSSADKSSPHKSDISANDNLKITIAGADGEKWLPAEWFDVGLPGDMAALDMDEFMDMDWETAFGPVEEKDGGLGKGKKRDEWEASDEWLKVYVPEKWEEKMQREQRRKK